MKQDNIEVNNKGMLKGKTLEPCTIVIFGASGDLSHKELIPALFSLYCSGLLPDNFIIIGFSLTKYNDETYRKEMEPVVKNEKCFNIKKWKEFSDRLFYLSGNFNDSYKELVKIISKKQEQYKTGDNILFHLAVPPNFYGIIIKKLAESKLAKSSKGWRRVIIEKPFGSDEESARKLDKEIHEVLDEDQIFRIDHFLGKETVQNMLVFRFANPGFEPIWNRNYIDNIQITAAEDIGIGNRGKFYDATGVIKDMVQNHLLQLLCISAIEPPATYNANSLRIETSQVLDAVSFDNIESDIIMGQYGPGNGKKIKAYRNEDNVKRDSITPTFVAMKLYIDNWRWAGVPFYLRTGKRLKRKLTEITIKFKPTPHLMFPIDKKKKEHNVLTFRLQPDEGIIYTFTAKQPGTELKLRPVNLNFNYATSFGIDEPPSSYQWLIFDAIEGDQTLFPKAEWIYKAWNIVDPIIKKWEEKQWIKFPNYEPGSWGPDASIEMIKKDERNWNVL